MLGALDRRQEALQTFDRALALAPGYPDAWCNRGNTLQDMGRLEEALASYDRALSLKPDFALALNNRGNVLQKLQRCDAALGSYDYALALDAGNAEVHANRADALQRLCRYDEALAGYDRAVALAPGAALIWNNRGAVLQHLGRLKDARASLTMPRNWLRACRKSGSIRGSCYLLQQDFASGLAVVRMRVREMPDLGEGRSFASAAMDRRGRYQRQDPVRLICERGLGDAIQYLSLCRFWPRRAARASFFR